MDIGMQTGLCACITSTLPAEPSSHLRKTEASIKNFSPYYNRQYSVAFCNHVRSEVEQQRDLTSQFLKTKPPLEPGTVLYEAELSQYAEDIRKWKDRYIVVKNDFAVESYENKEAYQRGAVPKSRILPAGGKVLTSEEEYNLLSDKHFPDPIASSEKNSQPFVVLPKSFPVYLWQPYLRHAYFCFHEATEQQKFSALLNDCIRHLNHGRRCRLLPSRPHFLNCLGQSCTPISFGDSELLEEAYNLVQHQVSEGLSALKQECRALTKGLEGTIRSDMDQIVNSKNFLSGKIRAMVAQPAEKSCGESVQPFLASILEELMGPVSSGFSEVRALFEKEVGELSQSFHGSQDSVQLKEHLDQLMRLPLDSVKMEPCYTKVTLLPERLLDLQSRFRFPHVDLVVQRTQNYMQELMENAVFTFEQLLSPHLQGEASRTVAAIEKVKLRVLKQYDYDSSTIRKKIFQEALIQITLPTVQKALASTCKPELQKYEQFIFADHTNMIHVENVYEEILYQILLDETLKVITEATVLKKHNLFEDNMALPSESVSSLTDLKTSMGSNQASPARRASAILPGVPDNEVFQEPEEKMQQPGVPSSLVREGSTSIPGSSPPSGGDGQVTVSSVDSSAGSPLTAEDRAGPLSSHLSEVESGETLKEEEPTCEMPESIVTPGSLKELKELLTVTVSIESTPVIENDTHEGTHAPQENEKEDNKIYPEASQTAAIQQDNCEESEVRESEAHPTPLEAESSGVDLGTEASSTTSQSTGGGLTEDTGCLGPLGEPSEAPEPAENVPPAIVSTQDTTHIEGKAVHAEAVTLQEDATLNSDPTCSMERNEMPQVYEDPEVQERNDSPALATRVHGCQWVVEDAPGTNTSEMPDNDVNSPEQPSEE
ncbi:Niban1 [Phodopus roborovskii]|uniref:Niban1 protein n=1 Tax=Phodopus roborovskii TaxID=109678 RepID=A0AAU9ZDG6_PHORO|nr:Niban1 [Phodopus roborovskii]